MHKSSEKIIWAAFFSLHIAISMFHDKASKNLNLPLTSYGGKDIVLGIVVISSYQYTNKCYVEQWLGF